MHAAKVGWIGQTFALARCSDTQGKRSRNRISKEERKTLVEKFIKKYQKSNSGTFPSLNLTHKEVGGSFYTVREIVREIIQENRILGPGDSALKVPTLQDCDDQPSFGSLYLDDVSNLSLAINGQTAECSQMEDQYGYNEHDSISEVVANVDKLSISTNSVSDVDESDVTIASSSNRFIFPQNLDVLASRDESNHFRGNSFFHKFQDADREASRSFGILQSEKEPSEQIFEKDHPYCSKDSITIEDDCHIGASPATTASSSLDAISNTQSEADTCAESLHALFSRSVGVTGSNSFELSSSSPLSSASGSSLTTESHGHINGASFGEVLTYSAVVAESDIELVDTETAGGATLKTYGVPVNIEKHLSTPLIEVVPPSENDGSQQDFKEKGDFLASSEETDLDSVIEKNTENVLVNEELREDGQSHGVVVSNIIVDEVIPINKSPASGSSELLAMEIPEGKVMISADKTYFRKESTLSGKPKDSLTAYGTAPNHVASSTGFTEHTPVGLDGQLTADSSKPQNVPQVDPFWDAIKKIFAAFVKFWTE